MLSSAQAVMYIMAWFLEFYVRFVLFDISISGFFLTERLQLSCIPFYKVWTQIPWYKIGI